MARRVFHSFNFKDDSQRVAKVKNIGVVEGQPLLSSNEWEEVEAGGTTAIQSWIDEQMRGKSCVVVLIGAATASRRWVKYEIAKGWNDRKGVVGVYIHNLSDLAGNTTSKGRNPFDDVSVGDKKLSSIAKAYDPSGVTSQSVFNTIKDNLEDWVEEAITIRGNN